MSISIINNTDSGASSLVKINDNFTDLDTTKADLASPTFTGTPTLPTGTIGVTQSASDNSTKLATTAYVDTAVAGVSLFEDQLRVATVNITAAQIKAAYATPITIVAAPGSGKVILPEFILFSFTYIAPQYASGGTLRFQYDTGGVAITNAAILNANMNGTANFLNYHRVTLTTSPVIPIENKALQLFNYDGVEWTTGNGTAKVFIKYRIITL